MKVLQVVSTLHMGGAEKCAVFLSSELRSCDIKNYVLSLYEGGQLEKVLKKRNTEYFVSTNFISKIKNILPQFISLQIRKILDKNEGINRTAINLRDVANLDIKVENNLKLRQKEIASEGRVKKILRDLKPDIVHAHNWQCKMVLKWAKESGVRRTIYSHHNIISKRHAPKEISELAEYLNFADWVTFSSEYQRKDFLKNIPYSFEKTFVTYVHSGFESSSKIFKKQKEGFVTGTISDLFPVKGLIFLIDAVKILKERGTKVELLVGGGDGKYISFFKNECKRLGIQKNVIFCGNVDSDEKLRSFHAEIDIFCLPSLSESLGLVLLESLNCGTPIIASNTGGIPEIVEDGKNGFLVELGDANALASKIEKFYDDRELLNKMGNAGHEIYWQKFSKAKVAANYLKIYEKL